MGQEWVEFYGNNGRLKSVPIDWTTLRSVDPFIALSGGNSRFRPDKLRRLVELIGGLTSVNREEPKADVVGDTND